ncbi:MAG: cytochrome C [Candidatus Dadabacteria bacterium]|nr:MAG: cytochrome C [Candidatus Dadabacteria bacterium]
MAQVFRPGANTFAKFSLFGAVVMLAALGWAALEFNRSDYVTRAHVARQQPVPFSHRHHAGELGIDCRYCHTTVERSAYANIPPTQICMNCHSQMWADSPTLEPVRASFRTGRSLAWTKVYDLPDFVYFNHSIHVAKGIGCATCHGRIDKMNLTYQAVSLQMEWCLDCHRHPERNVRPRSEVFNMQWQPPDNDPDFGARLVERYQIESRDDCSTCHR